MATHIGGVFGRGEKQPDHAARSFEAIGDLQELDVKAADPQKKVYLLQAKIAYLPKALEDDSRLDFSDGSRIITLKLEVSTPFAAYAAMETVARSFVHMNGAEFAEGKARYMNHSFYTYLEDEATKQQLSGAPIGSVVGRLFYHNQVGEIKPLDITRMGRGLIKQLDDESKTHTQALFTEKPGQRLSLRLQQEPAEDSKGKGQENPRDQ